MLPRYLWVLYMACSIHGQKEAGRLWKESGREAPPHPHPCPTLYGPAHLYLSKLGSGGARGLCSLPGSSGDPRAIIPGSCLVQTHLRHTAKQVLRPRCESSRSQCVPGWVGIPDTPATLVESKDKVPFHF